MALNKKLMYNGTLGISGAILYTAPASGAIVKEIIVCNRTNADATANLTYNGQTYILPARMIPANDTLILALSTVIPASATIQGAAGTTSAIDVIISGVEG